MKFGGSNLRRPGDIDRVVDAIRLYSPAPVVVVSAFYGVTNELEKAVARAKSGDDVSTQELRNLHSTILAENFPEARVRQPVQEEVTRRLDQLDRYLTGIQLIGDVPPFVHAAVLSYGERLSSWIVSQVLVSRGIAAQEYLPEALGLMTDGDFGNATCDFGASAPGVQRLLGSNAQRTGVAVVPGFYGVDSRGKTALFGRGGSDYSAASLARCLGAASVDLWKDVDGFLSADPSAAEKPETIPQLHYLEAAELSYFGAKVLHPRTVEPLFDVGIPVRVFNIGLLGRGLTPFTIVDGAKTLSTAVVKGVVSTDDVAILRLHGPGVGFKAGILARATGTLDSAGVNIKSVLTAQTAINILLARADLPLAYDALKGHHLPGVIHVEAVEDVSIVAAVGVGIQNGTAGAQVTMQALEALRDAEIPVPLTAAGASEVAAYFFVHRADRQKAVRAVHSSIRPKN